MQNPSHNLRERKKDLSPYLFHFTKGSDCKERLESILSEECLKSKLGYICFTESPLTCSHELFKYMESWKEPMYSRYGIGFKRDILIDQFRARPVIYGDDKDLAMLGNGLNWRYELLDIHKHDYTWLREWRIEGNEFHFSSISKEDIIVVAPTEDEIVDIVSSLEIDVDFNYEHENRMANPYLLCRKTREWIGISFNETIKYDNDNIIELITILQNIGEEL